MADELPTLRADNSASHGIRFANDEWEAVKLAASRAKTSANDWCRKLVLGGTPAISEVFNSDQSIQESDDAATGAW